MTKAVSNMEICFIKAVLLFCKHGHKKIENVVFYYPKIILGLKGISTKTGTGSDKNTRIWIRPMYPDLDPTKFSGPGSSILVCRHLYGF